MRLQAGVASDRGLVRSANEDSFLLRRGLYAVCDGMGGARGGEVASQMACLGLLGLNPSTAGQQDLRTAISNANRAIAERGAGEAHLLGMGTTLTAMVIREGHLTLAHVGDSRAYILHSGELTQLTEDHSWVGEMVRRGELTPEQAAVHPHRSVITRALGTEGEVDPDLLEIPVVPGDRVIICSDGLTGMVSDVAIETLMARDAEPQEVAELLVKAALEGGGEDNVTVIVVDVVDGGDEDESDAATGSAGNMFGGDQILFGPSDRGGAVTASSGRSKRSGVSVRERFGLSLPSMRPVTSRSGAGSSDAGAPKPEAGSVPAPAPKESEPGPATAPATEEAPASGEAASQEPSTAEEKPIPAPAPAKKKRRWRLFLTLAVILIVAIGIGGFAAYNSTVYYLDRYGDGSVALYRGLPAEVLGIELSEVYQLSPTQYDALASHLRDVVDSRELISKEDGQAFLHGLVLQQ